MARAAYSLEWQNRSKYITANFDHFDTPEVIRLWRENFTLIHTDIGIVKGDHTYDPENYYKYWYNYPDIIKKNLKKECDSIAKVWSPKFKLTLTTSDIGSSAQSTRINVNAKALSGFSVSDSVAIFVIIKEIKIPYYTWTKNVVRAVLPQKDKEFGEIIGDISMGQSRDVSVEYISDTTVKDLSKIRIIAFVQSLKTKEILGSYMTTTSPFSAIAINNYTAIDSRRDILFQPNSRRVTLQGMSANMVVLTRVSGKQISLEYHDSKTFMVPDGLAKGVYILTAKSEKRSFSKRILIK